MPTLEEWEVALSVRRHVLVDSSDAVAENVNDRQGSPSFQDMPKIATGLPQFTPPRRIQITPLELLFAVGRITTPRIENLADLSSTWARIRYIWAFFPDPAPSALRLSEEALDIDFHQKSLLSDEIGVGMSALIAERHFNGINPVDVQVALRDQIIPGLRNQYRTSPDYLFERIGGGYLIVECKGGQSGPSATLRQLKRGTEQLPSLVFPAGDEPLALVIATCLSDEETKVYIIDPPPKGSSEEDSRKYYIRDEKQFREDLKLTQLSNLYLYAGATDLAIETVPYQQSKARLRRLPRRNQPPNHLDIPELQDEYVGISQEVNLIGEVNRATVFQGLSENVFEAMMRRDDQAILRHASDHYLRAHNISRRANLGPNNLQEDIGASYVYRANNALQANVFGRDGTFLRIELSS
jgi:hypothetical protein